LKNREKELEEEYLNLYDLENSATSNEVKEALKKRDQLTFKIEKRQKELDLAKRYYTNNNNNMDGSNVSENVKNSIEAMKKASNYYKKLGLGMKKASSMDDKLKICFRYIDPKDYLREFSFVVEITDLETYKIDSIDPPVVQQNELNEMIKELNSTNDFSLFSRKMRRKFLSSIGIVS